VVFDSSHRAGKGLAYKVDVSRAQFIADNLDGPLNLALTLLNLPPHTFPASRSRKGSSSWFFRLRRDRRLPAEAKGHPSRAHLVLIEGAK